MGQILTSSARRGSIREYPAGTPLLLKIQEGKPVAVEVEIDR
jgi:hypothetical protein